MTAVMKHNLNQAVATSSHGRVGGMATFGNKDGIGILEQNLIESDERMGDLEDKVAVLQIWSHKYVAIRKRAFEVFIRDRIPRTASSDTNIIRKEMP
jgi:hypothetical protein